MPRFLLPKRLHRRDNYNNWIRHTRKDKTQIPTQKHTNQLLPSPTFVELSPRLAKTTLPSRTCNLSVSTYRFKPQHPFSLVKSPETSTPLNSTELALALPSPPNRINERRSFIHQIAASKSAWLGATITFPHVVAVEENVKLKPWSECRGAKRWKRGKKTKTKGKEKKKRREDTSLEVGWRNWKPDLEALR